MGKKGTNFLVGSVVLIAAGILIFGINFLKNTSPTEKMHRYHVLFDKVSTLQLGDPVKLNGVTLGRVKNIELYHNKVRVSFDIKQTFKNQMGQHVPIQIPVNSTIRVQNIGLMGERQIEIHLGDAQKYYKPGETLAPGLFDAGIAEAMGIAGKVFEDAEKLVLDMRQVVDSTVGDSQFIGSFRNLVGTTEKITAQVDSMVDTLKPLVLSSARVLEKTASDIHQLVNEQKEPVNQMVQNGKAVSEQIHKLSFEAESTLKEVKTLLFKINSRQGSLGNLINDSLFYKNLQSTLYNADSLFQIIKKKGLDVNIDIF